MRDPSARCRYGPAGAKRLSWRATARLLDARFRGMTTWNFRFAPALLLEISSRSFPMLRWALIFLVVGIVAGLANPTKQEVFVGIGFAV